MSNEVTTTTLTEIVNSEIIQSLMLEYAIDAMVVTDKVRTTSLSGSLVASFPAWIKDSHEDQGTEGTGYLSNQALETTESSTITVAQVGILRQVTEMAKKANILGEAALIDFIVNDGTKLCMEALETDLCAVFSSASSSVGSTGVDMGISDFLSAIAKLDTNKARGPRVCILDDQQALDLRAAVASSTAGIFANQNTSQSILNANGNGFVGELFNVPIFMTNLTTTANTAADVVGAMLVRGDLAPTYAPIGAAILWAPMVKSVAMPNYIADQIAISMCYGVGEISDFCYCKIVTDA